MTLEDIWEQVEIIDIIIILFGVVIGVGVLFGIIRMIQKMKQELTESSIPVYKAHARVVERSDPPANMIPQMSYLNVIFELDNGERKRFIIRGTEYYNYSIGDEGMLHWRGSTLVSFMRGAKDEPQKIVNPAGGVDQSIPTWKRIQMEKENVESSVES